MAHKHFFFVFLFRHLYRGAFFRLGLAAVRHCTCFPSVALFVSLFVFSFSQSSFVYGAEADAASFGQNQTKTNLRELALGKEWLRLLHYRGTLLGGHKSQADHPSFFVHPKGKRDPVAELETSVQAFSDTQNIDDTHPICRFPARHAFLLRHGLVAKPTQSYTCPDLLRYRERAQARAVALVFSSYYLNNPGSLFGHTFLRFSKANYILEDDAKELLDTGMNYAAHATSTNPVIYSLFGLFGGFYGNFTLMPYFYKVREYNDFESRDLWVYHLDLTQQEIDLLIDHFWELDQGRFDYYFLDENCSYFMLTAMEAIAPRLNLTKHLPWGWVIPADTIKAVARQPGFVKEIRYRPSNFSVLEAKRRNLKADEAKVFLEMREQKSLAKLGDFEQTERARLLDVLIADHEHQNARFLLEKEKYLDAFKRELLLARAKIKEPSEKIKITPPAIERPDLGHNSRRAALGYGHDEKRFSYLDMEFRFAFHDLLDPQLGNPRNISLEVFRAHFRYFFRENKVDLEKFTLAKVGSLQKLSLFNRNTSWQAELGWRNYYDRNCDLCSGPVLAYTHGYSFGWPRLLFSGFIKTEVQYSHRFAGSNIRAAIGPKAQIYVPLADKWKFIIDGTYQYLPFSVFKETYTAATELRVGLGRNFSVGARAELQQDTKRALVQSLVYF